MIERLQRKRRPQLLHPRFNRATAQQLLQQAPQWTGLHRMAGQHLGQEDRKGLAPTAPPPAIGTKHSLPPLGLPPRRSRIAAVKLAVPVQALAATPAGTPPLPQ